VVGQIVPALLSAFDRNLVCLPHAKSKEVWERRLAQALNVLQKLAAMPHKLFTGAFRQQYGALCFRRTDGASGIEILIITSRDSGRWIIPKGWPMKRKKPYEAAAIEAWEEAGVCGSVCKKPVGRYTYLKDLMTETSPHASSTFFQSRSPK
jgi:hypothetical protein